MEKEAHEAGTLQEVVEVEQTVFKIITQTPIFTFSSPSSPALKDKHDTVQSSWTKIIVND